MPPPARPTEACRTAVLLLILALLPLAGCAESSMVLKGRVSQLEQQQVAAQNQNQQLQQRAAALDRDNQELEALLAQTRQQSKIAEDQLAALRDQLRGVTTQLQQVRDEKHNREKQVETLTASLRRRGGVSITPNNSLAANLPAVDIPGVHVRRDGDVIRIELPAAEVFESGTNRLRPGASELIVRVARELMRTYPQQRFGVEGHTGSDPPTGGPWRDNHELSVAWAMTVYDTLISQAHIQASQLFVVGHGANRPAVSNATLDGKRRNRRVELVVYPERK